MIHFPGYHRSTSPLAQWPIKAECGYYFESKFPYLLVGRIFHLLLLFIEVFSNYAHLKV